MNNLHHQLPTLLSSQEGVRDLEEQDLERVTGGSGESSRAQQELKELKEQLSQTRDFLRETNHDKENEGIQYNQARDQEKEEYRKEMAKYQYQQYKAKKGVYYPR